MHMRRVAIAACAVFFLFAAARSSNDSAPAGPVQAEIFENVPAGAELNLASHQPAERYSEPAFGFVRTPTKYSKNALPLDRSTPFILRATIERALPAGNTQFRLRSKGVSWFILDGKVLLTTKPQKPNTSGDDPVPPPVEPDPSGRRSASYPHQDEVTIVELDGQPHQFTLISVIGGKGLFPSPGELSVSYGRPGEVERLLGGDTSPLLTDREWEAYAAAAAARHKAADIARRRDSGVEVARAWEERHERVRAWVKSRPAPKIPQISARIPRWNEIDRFIGARLEAAQIEPALLTSDLEFLRRVYLDTIGVIPTEREIKRFLSDPAKTRRTLVVERLLNHPGWADHWVGYWQDVLAENPGILKPDLNNTGPFRWWLHQVFLDNLPFDRFVTELIEMEGSIYEGGPAGFAQATLNDAPMAAKADILFEAFQGEKMACARCHDAPFHEFMQKDLFGLAAMLEGKPLKLPATSSVPLVEGGRKPLVSISLKPGDVIEPQWPFVSDPMLEIHNAERLPNHATIPSRHLVAAHIVSIQNVRFPQVVVNRIWKRYLGAGLVEPVDEWTTTTRTAEPSHPELLNYLSREFLLSGYDIKHIARLILSSHAYQRRPDPKAIVQTAAKDRLFAGPLRRRMTAEQVVDSLHLSVEKDFASEELNLNPAGDRPQKQFINLGAPKRSWEMTALSNERDRPALALPMAQSVVDVLTTYGWRQSRQNPSTTRDDAPSPMQVLILANGILGTRMVRLSDDSSITELCLQDLPLAKLIEQSYLRLLSRPPSVNEKQLLVEYLKPVYADRKVPGAPKQEWKYEADRRVTWSNHLSAEATLIRLEEEKRLRLGAKPTLRLKPEFRERFEDVLWALINSPEFVMIP